MLNVPVLSVPASGLLAAAGQPITPSQLWTAWSPDPFLLLAVVVAGWTYLRGAVAAGEAHDRRRSALFAAGLLAVIVALVSPLDALSGALASAHMVQHVVLVSVAAPLLALAVPGPTLARGTSPGILRAAGRWRRRLGGAGPSRHVLWHPAVVWFANIAVLWLWHSAVLYDAAVASTPVHALEHATFLGAGFLFWRLVVRPHGPHRISHGLRVLVVFTTAMASIFLAVLLTFARAPWYTAYRTTTQAWGLDPLADQQLAGAIMWVPAGAVYPIAALLLVAAWIRASEQDPVHAPAARRAPAPR